MVSMRIVGHPLMFAVTIVLSFGLLSSQLCNTICGIAGCRQSHVAVSVQPESPAGHCHEHKSKSTSGEKKHSSECSMHGDESGVLPATNSIDALAHQPALPVLGTFYKLNYFSFENLSGQSSKVLPFRSPPGLAALSMLRI